MSRRIAAGMAMTVALLLPLPGRADVEVRFVAPEHFSDRDFRRSATRAQAMKVFETFLAQLGKKYLGEKQLLTIEILDIRLAGNYDSWWSVMNDVRVLTDITPPRFGLRYTLKDGGRAVAQARESITDVNYLTNPAARLSVDPFVHEKILLENWFRKRFARQPPAGS